MKVGLRWWIVTSLGILSVIGAVSLMFRSLSTNVLDLLPAEDDAPEIQFLQLLSREQKINGLQTVIRRDPNHQGEPQKDLKTLTNSFVAALAENPVFTENYQVDDISAYDELGDYLLENRMDLLFPAWLSNQHREWTAGGEQGDFETFAAARSVTAMNDFLDQVEAFAFEEILISDPLLLLPSLLLQIQDNGRSDGEDTVLMWIETSESPLGAGGQGPVVNGI